MGQSIEILVGEHEMSIRLKPSAAFASLVAIDEQGWLLPF